MTDDFDPVHPTKPEQMLAAQISGREAHLLKVLREFRYGEAIVYKQDGLIARVKLGESVLLSEQEGLASGLGEVLNYAK